MDSGFGLGSEISEPQALKKFPIGDWTRFRLVQSSGLDWIGIVLYMWILLCAGDDSHAKRKNVVGARIEEFCTESFH